ncbi:MAG: VOC family protein [Actinomycetota bacterium]
MSTQTGWQVQVAIDCTAPHDLADWWAETLRWQVEPQDEGFIRSMIEQGHATDADTITHNGRLVWREACAIHPVEGSGPDGPRLLFQSVPEPKSVKNRVHLDLRPAPSDDLDLDAVRAGVEARGAKRIGAGRQGPHDWVVFADPEGNEFCL